MNMKFNFMLGMLLFSFFLSSCDKVDELTHFTMKQETETTIPSTLHVNVPINVWTPSIASNSTKTFESNNTHKNLIEEIILTNLELTISTEGASWDFMKSIEIYISADGVQETKIAWLYDIPQTGLKKLKLETSKDDLKAYIKMDYYKLRTKTVTRQIISKDINVKINSSFYVDAKILGI